MEHKSDFIQTWLNKVFAYQGWQIGSGLYHLALFLLQGTFYLIAALVIGFVLIAVLLALDGGIDVTPNHE
jgi:uncharacterized membrane protein AbrB (regulator of aidB expression)